MSVTIKLLHKNTNEVRDVMFSFSFTRDYLNYPLEIWDMDSDTAYYYSSFEKMNKEWEIPGDDTI